MDAVLAAEFNVLYRQYVSSSGWYLPRGYEPCNVKAEAKSHKVDCVTEACSFFVTTDRFGRLQCKANPQLFYLKLLALAVLIL